MVKIVIFNVKKVLQFTLTYKVSGSRKDQLVDKTSYKNNYCTPSKQPASYDKSGLETQSGTVTPHDRIKKRYVLLSLSSSTYSSVGINPKTSDLLIVYCQYNNRDVLSTGLHPSSSQNCLSVTGRTRMVPADLDITFKIRYRTLSFGFLSSTVLVL